VTKLRLFLLSLCVCLFVLPSFGQDQKLQLNDVISRHLDSIGTAQARAAVKSRAVRTSVRMTNVVGASGSIDGSGLLVSLGNQLLS
jgi:hypothetical protein